MFLLLFLHIYTAVELQDNKRTRVLYLCLLILLNLSPIWVLRPLILRCIREEILHNIKCREGRFLTSAWQKQKPQREGGPSSVSQSCPTLCDPIGCSTPGFPVQLLELLKLMSRSRWCHPTISSSVVPFSSCLQSFPTSRSFPMSHLFTWGGQSIGASAHKTCYCYKSSTLNFSLELWFLHI